MPHWKESELKATDEAADGIARILEACGNALRRGDREELVKVHRKLEKSAAAIHDRELLMREIREGAARAEEVPDHLFKVEWNGREVEVRHIFETGHSVFVNPNTGRLVRARAHEPGLGLVKDAVARELDLDPLRDTSLEGRVAIFDMEALGAFTVCRNGTTCSETESAYGGRWPAWVLIPHSDLVSELHFQIHDKDGLHWRVTTVSNEVSDSECGAMVSKAREPWYDSRRVDDGMSGLLRVDEWDVEWRMTATRRVAILDPRDGEWKMISGEFAGELSPKPGKIWDFVAPRFRTIRAGCGDRTEVDFAGTGVAKCESGLFPDHPDGLWVRIHEDEVAFRHPGYDGPNTWLSVFVSSVFPTEKCVKEAAECLSRAKSAYHWGDARKHGMASLEPVLGYRMEAEWVLSSRGAIAFLDPRNGSWWRIVADGRVDEDSTPESIGGIVMRRVEKSLSEGTPEGESSFLRKDGRMLGGRKPRWWRRSGG